MGKFSKKVEAPKVEKKLELPQRFFTDYDLGDPWQNDDQPCIGASSKDLCEMTKNGINTIALVNIKRKELGINFGDKVQLSGGPCDGVYSVEDEMNWRFRQKTPVYRPGTSFEIRGDIARFSSKKQCQGAYFITKL